MDLYELFKKLNISYEEIEHVAVYTVEEAKLVEEAITGVGCKNLFLTDKKGKYFLVMIEESKKANIKEIAEIVGVNHLSFAKDDDLMSVLGLTPGSVTPLGIINDKDNKVTLLLDNDLEDKFLLVHPNTNTKTMKITYNDLIKFIDYTNHKYIKI